MKYIFVYFCLLSSVSIYLAKSQNIENISFVGIKVNMDLALDSIYDRSSASINGLNIYLKDSTNYELYAGTIHSKILLTILLYDDLDDIDSSFATVKVFENGEIQCGNYRVVKNQNILLMFIANFLPKKQRNYILSLGN